MDEKTCYVVLGLAPGESSAAIRTAYHRLAKEYHPDVSGEQGTRAFQEISEAYRILADPSSRHAHDEQLERIRRRPHAFVTWSGAPRWPSFDWDLGPLMVPGAVRPSYDAMYERFLRNFTGRGVPKAEHLESLDFDLVLTADEALRGGIIRVGVPVFVECSACGGTGHELLWTCVECAGQGVIESERPVGIEIRPMTSSGTIIEVPLDGLGVHNFFLRLHVHVGS